MAPTITVAIPLHGSARWVDNIAANVRALPKMVTEIVISDQTCLDDAADQLRVRLADDPRVVVRAEPGGLGFADHYQLLLETGIGDLFMWMPHDDVFALDWVPILASALDAHPEAWLAFGQLHDVEVDGVTPIAVLPFTFRPGLIAGRTAVRMMVEGLSWVPFRGLFRRREVLAAGLRMDPAACHTAIDSEWVFSVALRSGLVYDDRATTWKRRYPGSTHTSPLWQSQHRGDTTLAAVALLAQHGPAGFNGAALRSYARRARSLHRLRARVSRVTPPRAKPPIRRARTWLLRTLQLTPSGDGSRTSGPPPRQQTPR